MTSQPTGMRTVLIIAGKDLLLTWRDRLGFFWWMIGFPLLIAVLIGMIFAGLARGPSKPMTVALVDEANSPDAREFITAVHSSGMLNLLPMSLADARAAVRQGGAAAYVLVPREFRTSPGLLFGQPLPISVGLDPSRKAESLYLQAALYDSAIESLRQAWFDPTRRPRILQTWLDERPGKVSPVERRSMDVAIMALDRLIAPTTRPAAAQPGMPRVQIVPVTDEVRPRSSFEVCFPIGIIWGLIGLAAELSVSNVRERETGTWLRLRIAPIRPWQILTGNGLACFAASSAVMIFLLLFGWIAFGIRLTNAPVLAVAVFCTAVCFVGVTMLLSTLGNTESSAAGASWAFLLVMAMLGGGIVPQLFMPPWMDAAANVSFVKWAIRALEGGIWRDYSLREVLLPGGILLLQGIGFGVAGVLIGRRP